MSLVTSWMPEMAVLPTPRDTALRFAWLMGFVRRILAPGPWFIVVTQGFTEQEAIEDGRLDWTTAVHIKMLSIYIAGNIEVTLRAPEYIQHATLIVHYYVPIIA
jgi:hypothetical protein